MDEVGAKTQKFHLLIDNHFTKTLNILLGVFKKRVDSNENKKYNRVNK